MSKIHVIDRVVNVEKTGCRQFAIYGGGNMVAKSMSGSTDKQRVPMASCTALLAEARKVTISLVDVNEHFICTLCRGYFRDAHKIKDCTHTFCAGCIRHYFFRDKRHNSCPTCSYYLGPKPLEKLVSDPAIQGLADKLLPSFKEKEEPELRAFYTRHGFTRKFQEPTTTATTTNSNEPKPTTATTNTGGGPNTADADPVASKRQRTNHDQPAQEPTTTRHKISFKLQPQKSCGVPLFLQLESLDQPLMATDPNFRIHDLRKYLALMLGLSNGNKVEILCRGTSVGGEYSIAFVQRTIWVDPTKKMVLEYRSTME